MSYTPSEKDRQVTKGNKSKTCMDLVNYGKINKTGLPSRANHIKLPYPKH